MGVATQETLRRGYVRGFCLAGLALFVAATIAGALAWADMYHAAAGDQAELTQRHAPFGAVELTDPEPGAPGKVYRVLGVDRARALIALAEVLTRPEHTEARRITVLDEIRGDGSYAMIVRVEE